MPETAVTGTAAPTMVKPRGKKKRKIVKRIISLIVVLAILAGGGFALYRFLNTGNNNIGTIFSQPAYIGSIQSKVSGSGNARASQSAAITLTQSGTVEEVFV
ncbi:MAG: hypothetical protein PUB51_07370, partial [Oscillospiraceae bacterium]|nr:hypothetical protein [Oscillospiraceae bacterium]